MRLTALLLLVASSSLLACSGPMDRIAEADNAREAMFRYMIAEHGSLQGEDGHCYFLSVQNGDARRWSDPSDAFMKRFAGLAPAVKKVSECDSDASRGVTDRATGARGHILHLDPIRWLSDREVELGWKDYTNGLDANGGRCRLRWNVGNWILVDKRTEVIS